MINAEVTAQNRIDTDKKISTRYIRKVITTLITNDPDAERMDPKKVGAARSIGSQRTHIQAPFERVEQDTVHLPFHVKTKHGISSDVHLIIAIDPSCSMPMGWKFVIGKPNSRDSLDCIHSILTSKNALFQELGIKADIDPYGTPALITVDNGPENRDQRFERLATLGIGVEYLKSRTPQGKPRIERLNRSLKEALETLPGCTRFNGVDGQRDPQACKDHLMTLQELERWVIRWFYESWVNRPLEVFVRTNGQDLLRGNTPRERWKSITTTADLIPPIPVPQQQWNRVLLDHCERKISRKTGISYEGFNYKGNNLLFLLKKLGECTVQVLCDPEDYRFIYVDLGAEGQVKLSEEYVTQESPAYSFAQMKELVAQQKKSICTAPEAQAFEDDMRVASTAGNKQKKVRKSTLQNRTVTTAHKLAQAHERARETPADPGTPANFDLGGAEASLDIFGDLSSLDVFNRSTGDKHP